MDTNSLAQRAKQLEDDAKAQLRKGVEEYFSRFPVVETISYLNSSTYNDENYQMPSNWSVDPGDTIVVNGEDDYSLDNNFSDLDEQDLKETKEALRSAPRFAEKFFEIFPGWIEIQFRQKFGTIEVKVWYFS